MELFLQRENETRVIEHSGSAGTLLALLDINPQVVLVVADGRLVTEDEDISDAKRVELLSVVSGG